MSEELENKYRSRVEDLFVLKGITACNHRPHPYMVGPKHVTHAADHCGGMLGNETCRLVPCAMRGCTISYDGHTSDLVMFLQLTRNCFNDEVQAVLKPLAEDMGADMIDGIALVDTPEHFRIGEANAEVPSSS